MDTERMVENCLSRIAFVANRTEAHPRVLEAIEAERATIRSVLRIQGLTEAIRRESGAADVDG